MEKQIKETVPEEKKEQNKSVRKGKKGGFHSKKQSRDCEYGSNDPRWYGTSDVVRLAGNLSFFKSLGLPIEPFNLMYNNASRVPGICQIEIMDALPISDSNSVAINAVNIAAKQQYALIRKANSGAKNYEWSDLIIYELARSSLNEVFAFIARAYGVAKTYNMMNRYQPRAILRSMGFDPDDFISNLANIRLWLNNFARRLNTLALPHSLSYFERKAWLYSSIYTDGQSAKSQVYYLNPGAHDSGDANSFWVYSATLSSNGGCLTRAALMSSGDAFAGWSYIADSWLDALLTDDDSAIISGDILKAYGDSNLFKCLEIPEDYTVVPVYNPEILSQFENLTTIPVGDCPEQWSTHTGDQMYIDLGGVFQDADHNLVFRPTFTLNTTNSTMAGNMIIKPVINFHHTDVTPDEVMVGTRLTTKFVVDGLDSGNSYMITPQSCGTEIVTCLRVTNDPASVSRVSVNTLFYGTLNDTLYYQLLALANFDWAPKMYVFDTTTNRGGTIPFGELETYRLLEGEELKKLHDTAGLYLLGVPLIDSYNKA